MRKLTPSLRQAALITLGAALLACGSDPGSDTSKPPPDATDSCEQLPQGLVTLPGDDKAHGEPMEWWYWTGHLQAADGRWFGFEEVFFLLDTPMGPAIMAHQALTDVSGDTFEYDVQFSFGAPATVSEGFALAAGNQSATGGAGSDVLHGELPGSILDLTLQPGKAPLLQHGDGYEDYSFGGYTYYYSRARMPASGTLQIGGESIAVSGNAWFDHQWGDLQTSTDAGWDWFAIQLDDDREIMIAIINDVNAPGTPLLVSGSISDAACGSTELFADDITVTSLDTWTSPHSACVYPMGWDITVAGINLTLTPVRLDQELNSREKTYWEGAATVSGDATGRAYIELVSCP